MKVIIEGYYDLLLLHRVVLEAKFSDCANDLDVPLSPKVAQISNQIVEELIASLEEKADWAEVDKWKEWRKSLKYRPRERRLVEENLASLKSRDFWNDLSAGEKKEIVRELSAPYILSDEEISEFLL